MSFSKTDFEKIFLKNFFYEIIKEKKEFQNDNIENVCEMLAELHVKEFGSGKSPYEIISEYNSVENWLINKVNDMKYDPQKS